MTDMNRYLFSRKSSPYEDRSTLIFCDSLQIAVNRWLDDIEIYHLPAMADLDLSMRAVFDPKYGRHPICERCPPKPTFDHILDVEFHVKDDRLHASPSSARKIEWSDILSVPMANDRLHIIKSRLRDLNRLHAEIEEHWNSHKKYFEKVCHCREQRLFPYFKPLQNPFRNTQNRTVAIVNSS